MSERLLSTYLPKAVELIDEWQRQWPAFEASSLLNVDEAGFDDVLSEYASRLQGNYPFFHPHYAGQMLKPPHPAAVVAYVAAMLINPNNHALDGGPPTSEMEKEVVQLLLGTFGYPSDGIGHLTSGGTVANLEALWVSRELTGGKAVAFSSEAHYTHARVCGLLGVPTVEVPVNPNGELDVSALEAALSEGQIGTVVATAGTTAGGSVDNIPAILELKSYYGFRLHVDAAYGGFFKVLADGDSPLSTETSRRLAAISESDSVVVDPHKHGLQPYGCGAILHRDPRVGSVYKHDSPYTYFTSDDLHLGEISFECSRAGAAAGALWMTLKLLPLEHERGLGPVLASTLRAAQSFANRVRGSDVLALLREPQLDIVNYYPVGERASDVDRLSRVVFKTLMEADPPVYLSLLKVDSRLLRGVATDVPTVSVLRSVLMKPEHEAATDYLVDAIEAATRNHSRHG